jgi:hypothetical protein
MSRNIRSVYVLQRNNPNYDPQKDNHEYVYEVVKLKNLTEPYVGEVISQTRVSDLIRQGANVEITKGK